MSIESLSKAPPSLPQVKAQARIRLAGHRIGVASTEKVRHAALIRDTIRDCRNLTPEQSLVRLKELRPSILALGKSLKKSSQTQTSQEKALIQEAIYETKLYLCTAAKNPDTQAHVFSLLPILGKSESKIARIQKQASKAAGKAFRVEIQKMLADLLVQGLPILNAALDKKKAKSLTDAEKAQLEQLLELAIGNKQLNSYLHRKKNRTKAETFLHRLSYLTLDLNVHSITEITSKATQAIQNQHLDKLLQIHSSCEDLEKKILASAILIDVSALQTAQHIPSYEQRFSQERLAVLNSINQKIDEHLKSKKLTELEKAKLHELNNEIHELITLTDQAMKITKDCEETCKKADYTPPLSREDAKALYSFEKLSTQLSNLQFSEGSAIYALQQASILGTKSLSILNEASYLLPNYRAGDIVFDEEALTAAYQGTKEPLFSEIPHNLQSIPKLIQALKTKGIWSIEPFFTGHITHASIIEIADAKPYSVEVELKYSRTPSEIYFAMVRFGYRPNFEALLTPEAKESLTKAHISIADIEKIYAERMATLRSLHAEHFGNLRNSALRAVLAFLLEKLEKLTTKFSKTATKQGVASPPNFLLPRYLKSARSMFCSEFVANFLQAIQANTEKAIQELLGNNEIKIFNDVIPAEISPKAIHPARLESMIQMKDYYKPVDPPLLTRLLFNLKTAVDQRL